MAHCVVIEIDSLILGRSLPCPIHDQKGTLLLAKGEVLTPEHKRRMKARGTSKAVIASEYASQVALFGNDPKEVERYERELNHFVDEALQTGRFDIKNEGPAVAEGVVDRGCSSYDAGHIASVRGQIASGSTLVKDVMADVHSIGKSSATRMKDFVASSTALLASDFGGTLSVALAHHEQSGLSEHALKMATLGMAMAVDMNFDAANVQIVGISGLLADIGMAQIPKELREADRHLSASEFAKVQRHTIYTANHVERIPNIPDVVRVISYQVHERPDGSGYPRARTSNTIHPFAMLLNVADAYIAMTTSRPHRPPMMAYAAVKQPLRMAQLGQADVQAVRALLHVLSLFPIGSYVALSDGSIAKVMRSNRKDYTKPIVARVQDADGNRISLDDERLLLDLASSDLSIVQALPQPGSNEVRLEGKDAEATLERCYSNSHN